MSSSTYESRADRAPRGALSRWDAWLGTSLCACLLALLGSLPLHAAPGDPDPSFGQDGHASFSFPGYDLVFASASGLQANGKLTIVGVCDSATARAVCALRMLPAGALDSSFGNGGRVSIAGFGAEGRAVAIAYQDDGRLLMGGECKSSTNVGPCVVRLHANGVVDTSFGVQGVVILNVSGWDRGNSYIGSMRLLTDGRIALGIGCRLQDSSYQRLCASRLQSNGVLDTSFGDSGTVTVAGDETLGFMQYLNTAAIDEVGRWLLAGTCSVPFSESSCAVRLQPNGARDLSFGTKGAFVSGMANVTFGVRSAALTADGRMVLGGGCVGPGERIADCFAAVTPTGLPDRAFGTNGVASVALGVNEDAFGDFVRQSDGALLILNNCYFADTNYDVCLRLMRSDGTLDPTLPLKIDRRSGEQYVSFVATDAQGRILVVSSCASAANNFSDQLCATRFEGGPFANTMCSFDLDGDGQVNPSVDGLIMVRASLGFSANSILQGVNFPSNAKRKLWGGGGAEDLRQYLVAQCGMSIAPIAIMN